MKYNIYNIDSTNAVRDNKGTKEKYWSKIKEENVLIKINKYVSDKDVRSHNVSEKIYSELAKCLNFSCVKTDFIIDNNLKNGIASYDYKKLENDMLIISGDDLFLSAFGRLASKSKENIIKEDYTYDNICKILFHFDNTQTLLADFNSIMVMDALTGESDRHYENWGIYTTNKSDYKLLPSYDNSSCLLHQFREKQILERTLSAQTLESYIYKSKCKISIDGKIYNHFDFIKYLLDNLPLELKRKLVNDIKKLHLLTDEKIKVIVSSVPEQFSSEEHKELIIKYIILRKNILLGMVD